MFIRTESFKEFIRFYPIVTWIIAINIVLYLLTVLPILPSGWLMNLFAGVNLNIVMGEYWRLVTPIFMHNGFAHLLFNSFSLVLFGPALERLIGKVRFLLVYFISGIGANVATLILEPLTYMHVGASGAIFGLFGFFTSIIVFRRDLLSRQNTQLVLTITIIGIVMTFMQANINVTAHLFGLLAGFLIGAATIKNKTSGFSTIKTGNWKPARQRFNGIPLKTLLVWGGIVLLAILGLIFR
ncbi:rhomboid family intramembrane serine protease [Cytobacillus purgationiresistens]|uniref:Membrane associated rhomboid family serine protease n=1 Tax=Cytobacillus purgationiresistens TaxID=863449 RepID=A0ABU0APN0_9BACI|nr:rhomboid family intramembrane serine protease [Cytobacillus purgationiresistens]MDQ0273212.1 membrane associated rhomboid family serine protease [Cytobacillus purgationiresistens]